MTRTVNKITTVLALAVALTAPIVAQQPGFDVSTSPQGDGYVTEGSFKTGLTQTLGVRGSYLNRLSYDSSGVAGTELSTDAVRVDRTEAAAFLSFFVKNSSFVDSIYGGISYVSIEEAQDSTYVQVDSGGEWGTEYHNMRDAFFVSPRFGAVVVVSVLGNPAIDLRYTVNISPLYYFSMDQTLTLENVGYPKDTYTNSPRTFGSPYIDQEIVLRLSRWIRVVAYHSLLHLPFETLVLAENGHDMEPAPDPTTMNNLRLNGDFSIPLGESISFNLGAGYSWSWTYQGGDHVSENSRLTTVGAGYFRVGASMWQY